MSLDQKEVALSVREHLENKGYTVSDLPGKYQISREISAKKDKDSFLIEAVGDSSRHDEQNIIFAVGKIVKRMKEQGFWVHYGLAMPKSNFKLLKDFEAAGFQALKLHLFLIDSLFTLTHLVPQETIDLLQQLKEGHIVHPSLVDIDVG